MILHPTSKCVICERWGVKVKKINRILEHTIYYLQNELTKPKGGEMKGQEKKKKKTCKKKVKNLPPIVSIY